MAPIVVSQKAKKARNDEAKVIVVKNAEIEGEAEAEAGAPVIVAPVVPPAKAKDRDKDREKRATAPVVKGATFIPAEGGYHLPSLELLDFEEMPDAGMDRNAMLSLADKLQKSLADFGVRGQVVQIHPGPVVTMYEFVPVAGTKLSKITSLSNDLAMSLEAMSVRIVAPIPGKGSCGIEVPNRGRAKVFLKEILTDDSFAKAKSKLTLGLGKDIAGVPVSVDLARMPHLLVAGTTGSGKSVSVNGMICSMLFNATPDEVRLIMIDPKMVELSIYEGIPHLLLPVVTDPKKANLALKWAVDEMERRYELVSKAGVRDLVTYNKKMEKLIADGPAVIEDKKIIISIDQADGSTRELEVDADEQAVVDAGGVVNAEVREEISQAKVQNQVAREKAERDAPAKLPYIVVIIDEFADLMMVAPKDVETSVARIAQKARAVGIHLILATQRPSVDVITGLIKANFPSRIAFQVASKIDARTVLDQQGAESLLGQGDSLFSDRGAALRRVHGALVTEDEIKKMVEFLKQQGKPVYDMDILKPRAEDGDDELSFGDDEAKDEFYDAAVRLVCETRMASVSMIQRRLQIGFNRAARLVEMMEREGIVGAANGSKPREVIAQAI
jgi:S-DNA-T family DNA segregation ATPase FtsK/SpoIIIE